MDEISGYERFIHNPIFCTFKSCIASWQSIDEVHMHKKRPAEAGLKVLAPRVGLEPTTTRLTAAGSTIELSRNCQVAFGCLLASNEIYYTDGGNRFKPQFQNFLDFVRCRF